jgi:hypothetical protein
MVWIDLYDPGKKQLVRRGDACKTIDLRKNPGKKYKNLQNAMRKLFGNCSLRTNPGMSELHESRDIGTCSLGLHEGESSEIKVDHRTGNHMHAGTFCPRSTE